MNVFVDGSQCEEIEVQIRMQNSNYGRHCMLLGFLESAGSFNDIRLMCLRMRASTLQASRCHVVYGSHILTSSCFVLLRGQDQKTWDPQQRVWRAPRTANITGEQSDCQEDLAGQHGGRSLREAMEAMLLAVSRGYRATRPVQGRPRYLLLKVLCRVGRHRSVVSGCAFKDWWRGRGGVCEMQPPRKFG